MGGTGRGGPIRMKNWRGLGRLCLSLSSFRPLIAPLNHPSAVAIIDPVPRIHSPCGLISRMTNEKVRRSGNDFVAGRWCGLL